MKFTSLFAVAGMSVFIIQAQVAVAQTENQTENQVDAITQKFTVLIDSIDKSSGSGVIIKKEGNVYSVLTNWHVVDTTISNYQIITPDGQSYPIKAGSVNQLPGVDAAIVQFTSNVNYQVAKLGNSEALQRNQKIYSAGFPGRTIAIMRPIYHFVSGKVIFNAPQSKPISAKGYSLVYDNPVLPGMSGGPIVNEQGELVGINGKVEIFSYDIPKLNPEFYRIRTARSLGIPIQTYILWANQSKPNSYTAIITKSRSILPVQPKTSVTGKFIPIEIDKMMAPTLDYFTSSVWAYHRKINYSNNFYLNRDTKFNTTNQFKLKF
ncbi:TPR domain protein [Calothrix sp. NIES-4071]|nr:TPR domain protein [Calothrix sp. NIES-4071]BAZ55587.1 TPR domain protein [Calothrix sp. NIES-4105]